MESRKKRLIYISNCLLDKRGAADPFFELEREWLLGHFETVCAVGYRGPYEVGGSGLTPLPSGLCVLRAFICAPFQPEMRKEMRRLRAHGKLSAINMAKLYMFTARGLKLHYFTEGLIKRLGAHSTVLYSFWLSFDGFAAALSKRKHKGVTAIARGHAYDIDPMRNPLNPYLMKDFICETLDGVYLISDYAMSVFEGCTDEQRGRLKVMRIGSLGGGVPPVKPPPMRDTGVLRLVSCSGITEIKQLPLLVDALSRIDGRASWTHIGGGGGEAELRAYAQKKLGGNPLIEYEITGSLPHEKVELIYEKNAFDAFINVSRLEGVPVSIMEALRAGIPVIAPRVGGIPEIVDGHVGILYEPDTGADGVIAALTALRGMPPDEIDAMRVNAQERWKSMCRHDALLSGLFESVLGEGDGVK